MKVINENMKVQYKRGLKIRLKDITLQIYRFDRAYQVSGSYQIPPYDIVNSPRYQTLTATANWLKKNFDIDLEWDKEKYGR